MPGVEELPPDTPEETPVGSDDLHELAGGSGWVTTKVAAAALAVAPRTIRDYIRRGALVARSEGEGVQRTWYVSVDSLHKLRNSPRRSHGIHRGEAAAEELADVIAAEEAQNERGGVVAGAAAGFSGAGNANVEVLRELLLRLEVRSAEAGELRARLELTERAESTLREVLERERERADRERERADRAEAEARELRARLDRTPPSETTRTTPVAAPDRLSESPATAAEDPDRAQQQTPEPVAAPQTAPRLSWWRKVLGL